MIKFIWVECLPCIDLHVKNVGGITIPHLHTDCWLLHPGGGKSRERILSWTVLGRDPATKTWILTMQDKNTEINCKWVREGFSFCTLYGWI